MTLGQSFQIMLKTKPTSLKYFAREITNQED